MKRFIFFILLVGSLISCDNEIDLVADYKTIPVVYGFINLNLDTNFIRIEKAFLDESENALIIAKNVDSLYFDDIEVTLSKGSGLTTVLQRIDGNTIGRPRESGTFATDPNWLYYFTNRDLIIRSNDNLTLTIAQNGTEIGKASTTIVGNVDLTSAYDDDTPIRFKDGNETTIGFKHSRGAGMYGINLEFNYLEEDNDGIFQPKRLTWQIENKGVVQDGTVGRLNHSVEDGNDFYRFLATELNGNARRKSTTDMTLEIIVVGSELRTIRDIELANQGVTGSQDLPNYTNVENGRGIFSSRYNYREKGINLNNQSIDSLVDGRLTKSLNFIN